MPIYVILQNPGHNRVYYEQSQKLSLAELKIACTRFESKCQQFQMLEIAGVQYLSFEADRKLPERDLSILSRLSFAFALFELFEKGGEKYLLPILKLKEEYLPAKISSLMKYGGKTNELFTRMMINVALLSSEFDYKDELKLLDPVAGKGTTLFEAAIHGIHGSGIEIEQKAVQESSTFFKKYLERERFKHQSEIRKVSGKEQPNPYTVHDFEYARTKEEFKLEENRKKLQLISGHADDASRYFKANSFHLLVGDMPYGIAHGNVAKNKRRSPLELLTDSLPGWHKVMKKSGILVLAWNKFVMPKDNIISLLEENGFSVFQESPYDEFEHRVDVSIKRDIVVARK